MGAGDSLKVTPIDRLPDRPHPIDSGSLFSSHVLSVSSITKEQLHQLFNLAHHYRICVSRERSLDHVLKGKVNYLPRLSLLNTQHRASSSVCVSGFIEQVVQFVYQDS